MYGERTTVPFRETDSVDHPVSPYAATKKAGELLCHTYHHLFGMEIDCLRFFTVYGPRQRPEMAIHKFADAMLNQEPITLFGDGSSARDYTYISDITDGVIGALESPGGYRVMNLGGAHVVSLTKLVDCLAQTLNCEPKKLSDYRIKRAMSRLRALMYLARRTRLALVQKLILRRGLNVLPSGLSERGMYRRNARQVGRFHDRWHNIQIHAASFAQVCRDYDHQK